MRFLKIGCAVTAVLILLTALAVLVGVWRFNSQYGFLFASPLTPYDTVLTDRPSILALIDPAPLAPYLQKELAKQLQREVPYWAVEQILPYQAALAARVDYESRTTAMDVFINEQRLGPLIVETFNATELGDWFEKIQWDADGMKLPQPGVLRLEGSVPLDEEAHESVWYQWGNVRIPSPLPPVRDHFIEVIGDNRDGGAYLAAASLMTAYGYKLDEQTQDISFPSFQFVTEMRLTMDVTPANALAIRMTMEVQEGTRDRVAVVNLKAAIDETLAAAAEHLEEEHGLKMTGGSEWEDHTVIYEWEIDDFNKTVDLLISGGLFAQSSGPTRVRGTSR